MRQQFPVATGLSGLLCNLRNSVRLLEISNSLPWMVWGYFACLLFRYISLSNFVCILCFAFGSFVLNIGDHLHSSSDVT